MDVRKAFRYLVGLVVAGAGLVILIGGLPTGAGAIVGIVVLAGGLVMLGYDGLANWLEDLFDRKK